MDIKLDAFSISDKDTTLQHNALIEQTVKALNSVLDEFSNYAPNSIALTYQGSTGSTDANNLRTNGFWKVSETNYVALHYPTQYGLLIVYRTENWVFQHYHGSANSFYTRFSNNAGATWGIWSEK